LVNRSQVIVLGFFAGALLSLVAILVVSPEVYSNQLHPPAQAATTVEIAFIAALVAFIALLSIGVLRRWRWLYWLILVAFLAGALRVPASIFQLAGLLPAGGPTWYVSFQGVVGLVQLGIGLALFRGYRRGGVWGAF
jgi:hypothetical protein